MLSLFLSLLPTKFDNRLIYFPDDLSIWNQSIDIDPDDIDEPVSSRTRSPQKSVPGRSGVGQGKRPDPGGQFKIPGDAISGQFITIMRPCNLDLPEHYFHIVKLRLTGV